VAVEGEEAMRKVLELSEETYQQLATLAASQQRPLEEMLRLCLLAYEQYQYHLHTRCPRRIRADMPGGIDVAVTPSGAEQAGWGRAGL
jgi:hypothetical protein